jgi:hypothetical protein
MADYIPGPDANFQAWQSNFVTYANANLAALGLVAADMTPVTTAQTGWATAFPAHVAAVNAATPPPLSRQADQGRVPHRVEGGCRRDPPARAPLAGVAGRLRR